MLASRKQITDELWHRGCLKWILYPHQLPIYQRIREVLDSDDPDSNSFVINCSRQYGKSFTMFLIAVEDCLRHENQTVVFVGPLKSQVNEIINGRTSGTIFASCPTELKPSLRDSALVFHNGSRIRLAGTDNRNYENLRGGSAHTIFMDEAGFMSDLESGVLPTVEPMTKTTGGKVIFASTPPDELDHDYYEVLRYHEEIGAIATYTIWDDRSLNERQLEKIIAQCRGRDTTKFKREYECQRIADTTRQVVPSFTQPAAQASMLSQWQPDPLYEYWHRYVVADWGGRDKTAILFAHYNFRTQQLIIEDHLDFNGNEITGGTIARAIRARVAKWPESGEIRYICDSNNVLIQNEMINTHGLPFVSTTKGRLHNMVETVKDWFADDRVRFLKEAEFVARCVTAAHWNRSRDEFARSKIYGHYDAMAALVYLIRNVDTTTDPVPALLGVNTFTQFTMPNDPVVLAAQSGLQQIFNPRKGSSFR